MLEIWFEGGIFWLLLTLWRNLHIFYDTSKFSIENKTKKFGKLFWNLVSEIH